ncbi:MAG: hypothetical protein IVW57_06400 [Ktedonobacterales bacterium]|nr:hypothetical protein [Ktedonobacterales bacterium]
MSRITRAVKATYNFFAGDAIILTVVIVAFALATALFRLTAPSKLNAPLTVLFIALIVSGLVLTLGRELAGRARRQ